MYGLDTANGYKNRCCNGTDGFLCRLAIELQSRLMQSVLEAETETAAFIEQFGLQELNLAAVRTCKLQFLEWNQKLLLQIQKIQSYGYHLEQIEQAVQLEILTLSKELPLLK